MTPQTAQPARKFPTSRRHDQICTLTTDNIAQLRDRLIFVQWDPSATHPTLANSNIVADGVPIPIILVRTASFVPVLEALSDLPRTFPARILRRLKEHVYALVQTNDPKQRLYVKDIDEAGDETGEIDVVFGVGAIEAVRNVGYRGLNREDLVRDVLEENSSYDAAQVIASVLPRLLRRGSGYVPVFRYLRLAGMLDGEGALLRSSELDGKVVQAAVAGLDKFAPPKQYTTKEAAIRAAYVSFADLASKMEPSDVVMYAPLLEATKLQPEPIRRFLLDNGQLSRQGNALVQTQYVKLVCIFDWLKNRTR
jgi:hypothetical protein